MFKNAGLVKRIAFCTKRVVLSLSVAWSLFLIVKTGSSWIQCLERRLLVQDILITARVVQLSQRRRRLQRPQWLSLSPMLQVPLPVCRCSVFFVPFDIRSSLAESFASYCTKTRLPFWSNTGCALVALRLVTCSLSVPTSLHVRFVLNLIPHLFIESLVRWVMKVSQNATLHHRLLFLFQLLSLLFLQHLLQWQQQMVEFRASKWS